jgi:hypothetical protein
MSRNSLCAALILRPEKRGQILTLQPDPDALGPEHHVDVVATFGPRAQSC